jgi:hypothetical protein
MRYFSTNGAILLLVILLFAAYLVLHQRAALPSKSPAITPAKAEPFSDMAAQI